MCCNNPPQLGTLTSEIFSETMASAANLFVDIHRLHLNDDMIDKLIALRVDKTFMDRFRSKNVVSSTMFDDVESNKIAKV